MDCRNFSRGRLLPALVSVCFFVSIVSSAALAQVRKIDFAGVTWTVRSGSGGPGPNQWSDSEESVWLDEAGHLHLKIRKIDGVWHSVEIDTDGFSTHGEHRFLVEGQIDDLDRHVVLGLFVFANDRNEIDIEYSKWSTPSRQNVGSYAVQPYSTQGNFLRFVSPLDTTLSTHLFNWQADSIVFASYQGLQHGEPPSQDQVINKWTYTGANIPNPLRNLRTIVNFWMFRGTAPVDTSDLEVIIHDVVQPIAVTSVDERPASQPEGFTLHQNYPNPFNPETTIRYSVPSGEKVTLKIYNTTGQEVRSLVNGIESAGEKTMVWDGRDNFGTPVVSGVYFYRLQTGRHQAVEKMALLR